MDDYEVGYGKPPKHGQFKKGTSGNPSGKKAPPKLEDILEKALSKVVSVKVDGHAQKLTMLEVIVQTLVRKAASGDLAATKLMLSVAHTFAGNEEGEKPPLTEHQIALLQDILATSTSMEAPQC